MDEEIGREADFWDHEVPDLQSCLAELAAPPDPYVALMLEALGDVEGRYILDFACGAGLTAARLAERGAHVTALDASTVSLRRAREVAEAMGVSDLVTTVGSFDEIDGTRFSGAVGRYALHHVAVGDVAARIVSVLEPGATAAFVETFELNPVLRWSRRHLVGRLGIPRYGTEDEHPLSSADIEAIRAAFGSLRMVVPLLSFLRIFDRQVLRARVPRVSRILDAVDDRMASVKRLHFLSFHQVMICENTRTNSG